MTNSHEKEAVPPLPLQRMNEEDQDSSEEEGDRGLLQTPERHNESTVPSTSSSSSSSLTTPVIIKPTDSFSVVIEPSDRVSLNTETMSATPSKVTTPITEHDIPLLQGSLRPSAINEESIRLAGTSENSGNSGKGRGRGGRRNTRAPDVTGDDKLFSAEALCGPNPKRITIIVIIILLVWISFVLSMNIHKEVEGLREQVEVMTKKISKLESQYFWVVSERTKAVTLLYERINQLMLPPNQENDAEIRQRRPHPHLGTSSKRTKPRKESRPDRNTVCTEEGKPCVFPFIYKGEIYTSCVTEWSHPKPWCATKVDARGRFIGHNSAWGNCLEPCP